MCISNYRQNIKETAFFSNQISLQFNVIIEFIHIHRDSLKKHTKAKKRRKKNSINAHTFYWFSFLFDFPSNKFEILHRKQKKWPTSMKNTYTHKRTHGTFTLNQIVSSCRCVVVSLFDMWMNWPLSQFTWSNRIHIERWIYLLFFCSNYKWHLQHLNALHHFWCQIVNISLCWIETIQQRRQLVYSVWCFFVLFSIMCSVHCAHTLKWTHRGTFWSKAMYMDLKWFIRRWIRIEQLFIRRKILKKKHK